MTLSLFHTCLGCTVYELYEFRLIVKDEKTSHLFQLLLVCYSTISTWHKKQEYRVNEFHIIGKEKHPIYFQLLPVCYSTISTRHKK